MGMKIAGGQGDFREKSRLAGARAAKSACADWPASQPAAATTGAGGGGGAAPGSTVAAQGTPVGTSSSKPPKNPNATKVQFWHAMGGALGTAVAALVDQHNDSQSDIYVDAIYQGNYDD